MHGSLIRVWASAVDRRRIGLELWDIALGRAYLATWEIVSLRIHAGSCKKGGESSRDDAELAYGVGRNGQINKWSAKSKINGRISCR